MRTGSPATAVFGQAHVSPRENEDSSGRLVLGSACIESTHPCGLCHSYAQELFTTPVGHVLLLACIPINADALR